ncbi:16S rRNA (guanine(527)-N(7))-methyltransferase RsmG, partial [Flavobacteriaceae bacterium]|nr:16S rRNA (guanine(527)-N(7))-methyltransferase RsmG [Flavobacteriaceae bacterium]
KLRELYKDWNLKINVVSRKDIDELYLRHVLHSLGIAKVVQFKPNTKVMDVGTGGGFPGIPLAILFPETHFHLVDSIGKKIKVVNEVAEGLGLQNISTTHGRVEEDRDTYDFIVSRAVAQMETFVRWTKGKINKKQEHKIKNGILYLKGSPTILPSEVIRATEEEKQFQIETKELLHNANKDEATTQLKSLQLAAMHNENLFEKIMDTTKVCSLGQVTAALFEVGGQYRRNM